MIVNDFMRVTVDFTIPNASNPCVMVWDFRLGAITSPSPMSAFGEDFVTAFIERYYTSIANVIHSSAVITHVALRSWTYPSDGYDINGSLFTGGGGGKMLPPFVTTAIQLTRSNYAMRNGRKAFPAAVDANLATNGTYTTAGVEYIADATTAWVDTEFTVESGDLDMIWLDVIIRKPVTPSTAPTVFSYVQSYGNAYFGTQNSRKS